MIQEISFKNFRRFENFPPMKLNDINILVGPNNAGKSTVAKALILVIENLKHLSLGNGTQREDDDLFNTNYIPYFHFDAHQKFDLHLGSFNNALFAGAKRKSISFSIKIDSFTFSLEIMPGNSDENNVVCPIKSVQISDSKRNITLSLDFAEMIFTFKKEKNTDETTQAVINDNTHLIGQTIEAINACEKMKESATNALEHAEIISKKDKLERKLYQLKSKELKEKAKLISDNDSEKAEPHSMPIVFRKDDLDVFNLMISTAQKSTDITGKFKNFSKKTVFHNPVIGENYSLITKSVKEAKASIEKIELHYTPAHSVSQKRILNKADKNDFLAQVVHEFYKLRVEDGDPTDICLKADMEYFGIGNNYRITPIEGEAYIVEIKDQYGWANLSSKGMGNIQLFTLLMQLAVLTSINPNKEKWAFFEEPELNLHPEFQSKLADLFHTASINGCHCFVETHSEYLVRRTQVLVANANFKDEKDIAENNPFRTYYFDKDCKDTPVYEMNYDTSGRFKESFGSGFYDQAGCLAFELSEKEQTTEYDNNFNWSLK